MVEVCVKGYVSESSAGESRCEAHKGKRRHRRRRCTPYVALDVHTLRVGEGWARKEGENPSRCCREHRVSAKALRVSAGPTKSKACRFAASRVIREAMDTSEISYLEPKERASRATHKVEGPFTISWATMTLRSENAELGDGSYKVWSPCSLLLRCKAQRSAVALLSAEVRTHFQPVGSRSSK